MITTVHKSRVGARSRAKLRQWSGKVTRRGNARDIVRSLERPPDRRRTLEAAKQKLRRLFD